MFFSEARADVRTFLALVAQPNGAPGH